jgi:S-formylglutathione hydrolase FrmB
MSVVTVRFYSEALGKQTAFNVIHPDQGEGPFPVLMQLHGYSDDSFSWLYNSNLVRHAANWPMIVVLPDGGTSRYLNLNFHDRFGLMRYEDLLVRDIRREVERVFSVRSSPWAIGGLSMGGYGALRIGMKYPDKFASIWAHSAGMLHLPDDWLAKLDDPDDASVFLHAEKLRARRDAGEATPVVSFDSGVDDFVYEDNVDFHKHLQQIGLEHTWFEHPGSHTWDYWDLHVREALAQHANVFEIEAIRASPG